MSDKEIVTQHFAKKARAIRKAQKINRVFAIVKLAIAVPLTIFMLTMAYRLYNDLPSSGSSEKSLTTTMSDDEIKKDIEKRAETAAAFQQAVDDAAAKKKAGEDAKALEAKKNEDRIKEEEDAKDEQEASSMQLPLAVYKEAKQNEGAAHVYCQAELINKAQWSGASRNWLPDYSWGLNGRNITIHGHDVNMKNGFGASRDMNYACIYNMDTKAAIITEAN